MRFWSFHIDHPEVFDTLVVFCSEWRAARRHSPVSIKMLWERLRWEHAVGDLGGGDFKLNNNFTSLYARLIMERHPEWEGLFVTRKRAGETTAEQKPDPPPWRSAR